MIFLYYLPRKDRSRLTPGDVESLGLGEIAGDCLSARHWEHRTARMNVNAAGPDGSSGCILALLPMNGQTPEIGHYPDRQTWRPIGPPDQPRYWLGWSTADPPRPETLRRSRLVPGVELELGDGQLWTAPTIRRWNGDSNLPQIWGVDPCGRFQEAIDEAYADWWRLSGEMWDVCFGRQDWSSAQTFAAAVRCLSLNYRVGPHETTALGLLTSDTYPRVFKAAVDGEALDEFLASPAGQEFLSSVFGPTDDSKKNGPTSAPPDTNSMPGPSAGSPTIGPAAENCSASPTATARTTRSPSSASP